MALSQLLLSIAICFVFFQAVDSKCKCTCSNSCPVELARYFDTHQYGLVCKCRDDAAKSWVRIAGPPRNVDTIGKIKATMRCFEEIRDDLEELCYELNPHDFEDRAIPMFKKCINDYPLTPEEKAQSAPANILEGSVCTAKDAWVGQPGSIGTFVIICECKVNDYFEMVPGVAEYPVQGTGAEAQKELDFFIKCSREFMTDLNKVCRNNPGDFDILSMQIAQTCCRRFYATSNRKFDCDSIVPQDLSNSKPFRQLLM